MRGWRAHLRGRCEAERYGRGGVGICGRGRHAPQSGVLAPRSYATKTRSDSDKRYRWDNFEGVAQLLIVLEGHDDPSDGLAIVCPMFVEIAHVPQDLT